MFDDSLVHEVDYPSPPPSGGIQSPRRHGLPCRKGIESNTKNEFDSALPRRSMSPADLEVVVVCAVLGGSCLGGHRGHITQIAMGGAATNPRANNASILAILDRSVVPQASMDTNISYDCSDP